VAENERNHGVPAEIRTEHPLNASETKSKLVFNKHVSIQVSDEI
jgi:hypothetical protein